MLPSVTPFSDKLELNFYTKANLKFDLTEFFYSEKYLL